MSHQFYVRATRVINLEMCLLFFFYDAFNDLYL